MLSSATRSLHPSIIRQMSRLRGPQSVDLTLGQPSLAPAEGLLEKAQAEAKTGGHGYTENAGLREVRELVATYHQLPHAPGAENTILTVGSEQALYLALTALLEPGDGVLIPSPAYPAYPGILKLLRGRAQEYILSAENGFRATVEALETAVDSSSKVLLLNTPANPFGSVLAHQEQAQIAAWAEKRGLVIISDEIYRELYFGEENYRSIAEIYPRSLLIGGLSKSCALTGYRLGYLLGPEDFIKQSILVHQLMVTCAPRFSQYLAKQIFSQPEILKAHLPYYQEARETISEYKSGILPSWAQLHLGEGAFYAIIDLSEKYPQGAFELAQELAQEADVLVVPGLAFGEKADWFWRLSYAQGKEAVSEGLARIAKFLGNR